jgi:anti-sigma regulatory factor (Ser/Thr protein kinase)
MKLVEIKLRSTLEHAQLGSVAAAHIARTYCSLAMGLGPDADNSFIHDVELAVGEACTNAVLHNSDPNDGDRELMLSFKLEHNQFVITIKDQNKPFKFNETPEPDFASVPENGYGIHLMKSTMDNVSYSHENGWNIITMTKRLKK